METTHKQIVLGILAHVDSGKTTLSEAMLYRSGVIRKLGRVDHKDAFLDTDTLEKARGITIFSKQALLTAGNTDITLLDTPGHVDFSTETERTLQVLDYAVLVVSGTDGVQSHTETLWRLLRRYHVPTFVFVNKMDLPGKSREELLAQLNHRLGEGFVAFDVPQADRDEALALCDENLMDRMLDAGQLTDADLIPAVARRHVFPCWFGSALRRTEDDALESVDALMDGIDRYTRPAPALDAFGAKVFKVSQDEQGTRLTWLRVTGGELKVKAQLSGEADGEPWEEKANQLRLYSGAEVFADPSNIRTLIEQHELITLGGSRYLLVEFDFGLPGSVLLRTLEAIAQRGLVPVVAHPERYDAVQRDPGLAAWCFSRGMLLQLNKGSLLGLLGSRAEDTALHLLSHGLAHLIASDAHDDRFRTTGFRSLLPVLEPICHPDYIALLLHGNPRRILRDEPIPIPPLQSD